jgi:hypothetical protein
VSNAKPDLERQAETAGGTPIEWHVAIRLPWIE